MLNVGRRPGFTFWLIFFEKLVHNAFMPFSCFHMLSFYQMQPWSHTGHQMSQGEKNEQPYWGSNVGFSVYHSNAPPIKLLHFPLLD